jgi:mRNA interferase MazF
MTQGEIVLITFPFTDLASIKVRPALVISKEEFNKRSQDALFIMITSNTENLRKEDILLKASDSKFPLTGLKKESAIRTPKIYCLSKSLAKRKLGTLHPEILAEAIKKLTSLFK